MIDCAKTSSLVAAPQRANGTSAPQHPKTPWQTPVLRRSSVIAVTGAGVNLTADGVGTNTS